MLSLWLDFILFQLLLSYVRTEWPPPKLTNIQLLGLFPDSLNTSQPTVLSVHSNAMFKAAIILSQQYNITIEGQFIGYQSVKTGGKVITALGNTCSFISSSNIVGIVGPALSAESNYISPFAAQVGIPIISYASTYPGLSDRNTYPSFYRTVPSDNIAALAITKLFMKFNWTSCIIIYQNDEFGSGGAQAISETFRNNNLSVINMIAFDINTHSIRGDLKSLLTESSTRIVILWAMTSYASLVLEYALQSDVLGPQFTWILSANIPLETFNNTFYEKLNGMLIIEPVVGSVVNEPINTTLLNEAYRIWQQYEPESFPGINNVSYYALFAFDSTWLLIQSLKQLCSIHNNTNNNYSSCTEFIGNSFCFNRSFVNSNSFYNIINNIQYLGVSGSIQFTKNITDRISGIYYVSRNIQLFSNGLRSVPVLVWSYTDDWILHSSTSVIVWPGNSLITPSGYASLTGVYLRIAVTEAAPFTMITQITDSSGQIQTKLIGYVPELIELLRVKMGFIPIITLVINQTFNDIVNSVANNAYDMFVAQTTITATRRQKVAFSSSIFDNSLRVLIRKESNNNVDLFSYLTPFSTQLWITLLGACVYAAFLICLLEREQNPALQNKSTISLISMSMWYSIGTIVGYGVDFHVVTACGRILTVGLYILSLVCVAAYTANLASDLTISKSQDIIDGIDDIKNGKIAFSRVGILVGSSLEDYYLREISGGNKNFHPMGTKQEVYDDLLNHVIDASIMDAGIAEYITSNIYCNLTVVGTDFERSAFGIVYQKLWQYEQILDINILSLRESGSLDTLKRKWFQATFCSQSSELSQAMTLVSMSGLFFTFGIISIIALVFFIWKERFHIRKYIGHLIYPNKSEFK
ncbi:unnamed protein product [Adineta steineri]|uniref:Ionotropic glutamate receptor C-terminal domain-containing protein n=2 Tax=Adineta steineri TaxID=433720 RepID=A0A818HJF5_9BILA|nr:unnamed protein product [Adineta steineri]CAF3507180.1 unnamed protein product [Adineta steineri]